MSEVIFSDLIQENQENGVTSIKEIWSCVIFNHRNKRNLVKANWLILILKKFSTLKCSKYKLAFSAQYLLLFHLP